MRRFAAILALATLLACASADHHSGGPKTHDVTPTPESTNIWGLMPYDDLEVTVGTTIIFRSPQGFHDIALVPTRSEMDSCDVSNATVVMDQGGVIQPDFVGNSTSVTEEGFFYVLSWTPTETGEYYFVCTVGGGGHCQAGQKFAVTVAEGAAGEDVTVMGAPGPFWTVVVAYEPMTIKLGDSVKFVSDSVGYHDVVLLKDTCGPSTEWDCCGQMMNGVANTISAHEEAELYSKDNFVDNTTFIWTPTTTGLHNIVCEVQSHCEFGQRITINVEKAMMMEDMPTPTAIPDSGASSTSLLATAIAVLCAFVALLV